jgi:crotonobetainyl-CoA:carnitine CoA-transferase CaiB-like acyl-CoA transferase
MRQQAPAQRYGRTLGPAMVSGPAFRLAHGTGGVRHCAPRLGQHSEELLREAGYDAAAIRCLQEEGALGAAPAP